MDKQEALNKIKELEKYIEDMDKKKLVRVYVKEWDQRPSLWNSGGEMDYLQGRLFEDVSKDYCDSRMIIRHNDEVWALRKEDVILVEGSFDDL